MRHVLVVPYDPQWPAAFARAEREVKAALGDNLLAIHHIGSTSIPGMHAKSVIDMLAVARDLQRVDACATRMREIGYEAMGEFEIEGRRYFRRDNAKGVRTEHVHAFAADSPHILRHLAFRDFLRAQPDLAQDYAQLKLRLAARTWMGRIPSSVRSRQRRLNGQPAATELLSCPWPVDDRWDGVVEDGLNARGRSTYLIVSTRGKEP